MSHSTQSPVSRWLTIGLTCCVCLLVLFGAALYTMWPKSQSLHGAAVFQPGDIPKMLVLGHDVNELDHDGFTPLMKAVINQQPKSVALLLDAGADPNMTKPGGGSILASATLPDCVIENEAMIRRLLEAGADPNVGEGYRCPIHYAVWGNAPSVVSLLIEHGADVERRNQYEETPLNRAARMDTVSPAVLQVLIDAGADLEAQDSFKNTPLHGAVASGAYEKVQRLLDAGASPTAINRYDRQPVEQRRGDDRMQALFDSNRRSQ